MFALLINRVDRHKYYQNTRPFLLVQSEDQYSIAHPLRGGGVPVRTTARWSEQYRWMVSTYTAPLIEQYWSIGWCYRDCERCVVRLGDGAFWWSRGGGGDVVCRGRRRAPLPSGTYR